MITVFINHVFKSSRKFLCLECRVADGQIWSCLTGYGTFDRFAIRGPHSTIGEKYIFYLEIYISATGP